MKYMLTLFMEERNWEDTDPAEAGAAMAAWDAYTRELRESGAFVAGEGLAPSATATTIRLNDEHIVTDGPYAETKEQLAGFYLIDVADLDAALEWAHKIPMPGGAAEVRPVMDYEATGSEEHATSEEVAS
jgi:hypothetical protein